MPTLTPYLIFGGHCAEAMTFYAATLSGKLEMSTYGDSPGSEKLPPEAATLIMHARLEFAGQTLMASDSGPGMAYDGMKGISLALAAPTADEGRALFDALAVGGQVTMPYAKTFWAEAFGMLVDRYGVSWMVNVDAPA